MTLPPLPNILSLHMPENHCKNGNKEAVIDVRSWDFYFYAQYQFSQDWIISLYVKHCTVLELMLVVHMAIPMYHNEVAVNSYLLIISTLMSNFHCALPCKK